MNLYGKILLIVEFIRLFFCVISIAQIVNYLHSHFF
jgi:hypothetical protein